MKSLKSLNFSMKIRRIRACTHQRPQRNKDQYAVFKIWNQDNILEDIKRGPYSKKSPICRIQLLDTVRAGCSPYLQKLIMISDSSDDSNGPSIPRVPVYGPSVQGLLDKYGYDNIEEYLSDFYFPSTDKEDTIVHIGQDPIHECHSPESKAKYVPVSYKHNLNVKSPNAITGCVLGLPNIDIWDDILNKFRIRTPGRCADKWMNDSSDDSKGVSSKEPSITSIPKEGLSIARLSKEPIPKELLAWYGYDIVKDYLSVAKKPILKVIFKSPNPIKRCVLGLANDFIDAYVCDTIEEYLEWNYFPRTDNESTNMETTNKGNTDKDCIDDSNSAMSKGKYVPVYKKHNPNMYSHIPVTGCVLGLASVTTWDEIEKKIGARKSKTCADKAKGKRKVSCGS
ncbi:hypothetical protein Tco_0261430 [Tanacetum coccineum]